MPGMYIDRLARVVPPRQNQCRVLACNAATTIQQIDNDIFQFTPPANSAGVPGSFGRALMRCHAEGNDLYILFGSTNAGYTANSASVSAAGANVCDRIPVGQERDFEIDPVVDKFFSCNTINGGALAGTLRYRIVSFPTKDVPAG